VCRCEETTNQTHFVYPLAAFHQINPPPTKEDTFSFKMLVHAEDIDLCVGGIMKSMLGASSQAKRTQSWPGSSQVER
jgi:hypothetical protein